MPQSKFCLNVWSKYSNKISLPETRWESRYKSKADEFAAIREKSYVRRKRHLIELMACHLRCRYSNGSPQELTELFCPMKGFAQFGPRGFSVVKVSCMYSDSVSSGSTRRASIWSVIGTWKLTMITQWIYTDLEGQAVLITGEGRGGVNHQHEIDLLAIWCRSLCQDI